MVVCLPIMRSFFTRSTRIYADKHYRAFASHAPSDATAESLVNAIATAWRYSDTVSVVERDGLASLRAKKDIAAGQRFAMCEVKKARLFPTWPLPSLASALSNQFFQE